MNRLSLTVMPLLPVHGLISRRRSASLATPDGNKTGWVMFSQNDLDLDFLNSLSCTTSWNFPYSPLDIYLLHYFQISISKFCEKIWATIAIKMWYPPLFVTGEDDSETKTIFLFLFAWWMSGGLVNTPLSLFLMYFSDTLFHKHCFLVSPLVFSFKCQTELCSWIYFIFYKYIWHISCIY